MMFIIKIVMIVEAEYLFIIKFSELIVFAIYIVAGYRLKSIFFFGLLL